ncbi:hypothetical protein [Jidongwangia harbinensis]|uniref:hypothetical protein n=1 Tax=Jidongwangia harbinensis TaxID=2878561 RepID=UPI001CD9C923|nr:hypothetical protein [Jidongwangia harbinensis]MCA2213953.1 hypothetical protein [Jidongwangia harbinensis]
MTQPTPAPPAVRRGGRVGRALAVVLLPLAGLSFLGGTGAGADSGPAEGGYTLASTVSPAPLTPAGCAADPLCAVAPAPVPGDNHPALKAAVAAAAATAVPAVVHPDGTVLTPASPATVLLAPGEYRLGASLRLPPNVNLRGSGITATTLSMLTSKWASFSYGFLLRWEENTAVAAPSPGSTNLVADLTVNGNCREGAGAPVPADAPARPGEICDFRVGTNATTNVGGGVSVGDRWTVRQVRFTNLEYFKLWVNGAKDVRLVDNRFDNWGGAESGDEDNIGGGGRHDGAVVEYNQFDRTIRGNSLDFSNAVRTTIRANTVYTDPAIARSRDIQEYGNLFLEGVQQADVADNLMYGAHIVLQSNSKYSHTGPNKDVTNPRDSTVRNNRLIDSFGAGVSVTYDDYADADGTYGTLGTWQTSSSDPGDHVVRPGGGNVVRDNTIERPRGTGVVVAGMMDRVKNAADTIAGNTVLNAGSGGDTEMSTGGGTFETSGVGVSIGNGDRIYGNHIRDDQAHPTTWFGVHLGARNAVSTVRNTVLTGPAGETNVVDGLIGVPVRLAAAAATAPAGLTVAGTTVTWAESYPVAGAPVAGYRVYRDNVAVADLPLGSAAVPGNLITDADAGVETDAAGWTPVGNTTVAHYRGTGALGAGSLALTASAAGSVNAAGRPVPVTAGQTYTTVSSYRALTGPGRRSRAGIEYYDANQVRISRLASFNYSTVDQPGTWITSAHTSVAPANAAYAKVFVLVDNAVAGEVHLVDRLGLVAGGATEQWTDPVAAPGVTYRVAAYRQGDAQPGWLATGTAP